MISEYHDSEFIIHKSNVEGTHLYHINDHTILVIKSVLDEYHSDQVNDLFLLDYMSGTVYDSKEDF